MSPTDPSRLRRGTGRFMRHVRLTPEQAIDVVALRELVRSANSDLRVHVKALEQPRAFERAGGATACPE